MSTMNRVQITAKLYEIRDTMRRFWGEEFSGKVTKYQGHIHEVCVAHKCDTMRAAMVIAESLQNKQDSAMTQALVWAAYVEMIEPSEARR